MLEENEKKCVLAVAAWNNSQTSKCSLPKFWDIFYVSYQFRQFDGVIKHILSREHCFSLNPHFTNYQECDLKL